MDNKKRGISGATVITFLIVVLFALWLTSRIQTQENALTYTQFVSEVKENNVSHVTINQNRTVPTGYVTVTLKDEESERRVYVSDVNEVQNLLMDHDLNYELVNVPQDSWVTTALMPIIIAVVVVMVMMLLMNRQGGGANAKAMSFGKSRATLHTKARTK